MTEQNIQLIEAWARLVGAIALFAWPIAAVLIVLIFKADLSRFLARFKRGKVFGQEVELESLIVKLQNETEAIATLPESTPKVRVRTYQMPMSDLQDTDSQQTECMTQIERDIEQVLVLAAESPAVAVLQLGRLLEEDVRRIAKLRGSKLNSLAPITKFLNEAEVTRFLEPQFSSSLRAFWKVRNEMVHGMVEPSADLRVVEAGISLLRSVRDVRVALE